MNWYKISQTDDPYIQAIESGDIATVHKMVDETAKAKGYNVGPVFHGTKNLFKTFRTPAWFSNNQQFAENFAGSWSSSGESSEASHVQSVYLSMQNPYQTSDWSITEPVSPKALRDLVPNEYDSVLFTNPDDSEESELIVFSPEQIKSSDPITRDDTGNIIPLSERFNTSNPDVRY